MPRSDSIDASLPLPNSRHEAFAQAVAKGSTAEAAYKAAGYRPDRHHASRLATNGTVSARISVLKAEIAKSCSIDRNRLREWCERIIAAKPDDASGQSDICETIMTKQGPHTVICSKMGAADRLMKLCGWAEPEKVDAKVVVEIKQL